MFVLLERETRLGHRHQHSQGPSCPTLVALLTPKSSSLGLHFPCLGRLFPPPRVTTHQANHKQVPAQDPEVSWELSGITILPFL